MGSPDVLAVAAAFVVALSSPRRVTWLDLLVVFALTAAAFASVLRTGFAPLDDGMMLSDNPNMRHPTWDTLKLFWSTAPWHIYMPLVETVWQGVALYVLAAGGARRRAPAAADRVQDRLGARARAVGGGRGVDAVAADPPRAGPRWPEP